MRCETLPLKVCSLVWDYVIIHLVHIMVHLGQPRCCTMPMGRDLRYQEAPFNRIHPKWESHYGIAGGNVANGNLWNIAEVKE